MLQDGLTIPDEIKRREDRIAKLSEAEQAMEARTKERLIEEQAIGFRRFLLRGQQKVELQWTLMTTSYNLKRLFNLEMQIKRA